jgi:hypothetical protein
MDMRLSSVRRAAAFAIAFVSGCAADPGAPSKIAASVGEGGGDARVPFDSTYDAAGLEEVSEDVSEGIPEDVSVDVSGDIPEDLSVSPSDSAVVADSSIGEDVVPSPPLDGFAPPSDATSEITPIEASQDAVTCSNCPPPIVDYATPAADAMTQDIRVHLDILNPGASPLDLGALTIRYWFTADGSKMQSFVCDYARIGCSSVQASFVTLSAPKPTADHYLQLSFASEMIPPGGDTGEIQARFHDSGYSVTFVQTNDYSFDAAHTMFMPWNRITLYKSGALVWGTEP